MRSQQVIQRLDDRKLVAVVRESTVERALAVADAAVVGGIQFIEFTMTIPKALQAIETACQRYGDEVVIGAGTVLDSVTARLAMLSGAAFVVSPAVDAETIRMCHLYQVPVIPGVSNIQGTMEALALGCGIVKFFPANLSSPKSIQAMKGPIPQAEFVPTGGVNVDNIRAWLDAGAMAVGIGSDLSKQAQGDDLQPITDYAARLVQIVDTFVSEQKS
ncbi:MAG: bifunctional 2-keto-4-hydroxyglutarate aldolase/2-keto-3-deoxy-6-phosphogluconate aldolase [Firmicutes bacterium]|nr:bifunctional 2-keto-4-hydroxyglutarate aldolase/2-keto-3-deoxy-6-phosphogluconate aldolase [Bacillota bacterium]